MKFDLTYTKLHKLKNFEYEIYDGDYDYTPAYLRVIEDAFTESEEINFTFSSLQENWDIYLNYDFSVFIIQLLNVYRLCNSNPKEKYLLDFYAQGTERKLLLIKTDETTIKVENVSGEKWLSQVPYEYVNIEELRKDILHFVHKIKAMVDIVYPEINTLEMLQKWYHSFEK